MVSSEDLQKVAPVPPTLLPRRPILQRQQVRFFSFGKTPGFTHLDENAKANMVDISEKTISVRMARAEARIRMSTETYNQLQAQTLKKGDVFTVSKLAGIQAAKQTSLLIPLCHQIPLSHVDISFELKDGYLFVRSTVKTVANTGVEVEAMTSLSIACCTVFDMCKSVDKGMMIEAMFLVEKSGGKSGHYLVD